MHLFGRPVEWEELQTAVPQEVVLVEDAAGALGARYRGIAVRLARPDGLPVVPPAQDRHHRRGRRRHDRRAGARRRGPPASATTASCRAATSTFPSPGLNYRLPDILCAIGIPQLARLEQLLAARERVAGWYTERLEHLVLTPSAAEGDRHGWQAYVVQLDRRDEALHALRAEGIEVQIGTYALHHLGAYRDRGSFPGADRAFARALALPFATTMTEAECDRVAGGARPRFV